MGEVSSRSFVFPANVLDVIIARVDPDTATPHPQSLSPTGVEREKVPYGG
jgi:hypothetical protein